MRITNKHGIPQPFVDAVKKSREGYLESRGDEDISVSELIGPPQIRRLRAKHNIEISVDVMDLLWSLYGTAMHDILEKSDSEQQQLGFEGAERTIALEKRYYLDKNFKRISGKIDRLVERVGKRILQDYKVTSVFEWKKIKPERAKQLNVYAHIMRESGEQVDELEVVYFFRDWRTRESQENHWYPPHPVMVKKLRMWKPEKAEYYILERLHKHYEVEEECADSERWYMPEKYIVKLGKLTDRVFYNKGDAEEYIWNRKGMGHYMETEPRGYLRCSRYCDVAKFCSQFKEFNNE